MSFDPAQLAERLQTRFDSALLASARLRFVDRRVWTLAELLANAVGDPDPLSQLYGEGLSAAIAAALLTTPHQIDACHGGLAPAHLRRVLDYLDAHLPDHVSLAVLAELSATIELVSEATGFASAAHFGRTFRKLVGATPAAWRKAHRR